MVLRSLQGICPDTTIGPDGVHKANMCIKFDKLLAPKLGGDIFLTTSTINNETRGGNAGESDECQSNNGMADGEVRSVLICHIMDWYVRSLRKLNGRAG